ncbi:MAG: hypothetical protein QF902_11965 [Rhodospirillales bacterium]|nr:hypothetical protein [Rhodospirillales bacterium]
MKRLEPQDSLSRLDRAVVIPAPGAGAHETLEGIDRDVAVSRLFVPQPVRKRVAGDLYAVEQFSVIQIHRLFEIGRIGPGGESGKTPRIDVKRVRADPDPFTVRDDDGVGVVAERLSQAPQTGPKVVERSVVCRLAPKKLRQRAPAPPTVGLQGKIGKQDTFAPSRKRDRLTIGTANIETAEQPQK